MNASAYVRMYWPVIGLLLIATSSLAWPIPGGWLSRLAMGWSVGVALFLVECAVKLARTRSTADIRKRSEALDEAGPAVLPLALAAALASVAVVIGAAVDGGESSGGSTVSALMALTTVVLSWTFVHVIFALHYAHAFYSPAGTAGAKAKDRGGLIFPGDEPPDYWDFLHFSLIIGVASQTADVQISDKRLRRTSTVHSVTAFLFNTVIVALSVNLAVTLLGN